MKYSNDLFCLIKSLTKTEKRFFNIYCSGKMNDNVYLNLFKQIDQQNEYDERAIRRKLNKDQFHVYKNYLYRTILKVLSVLHSENTVDAKIKNELNMIGLLCKKKLYHQAYKLIPKLLKIAEDHHRYLSLLEIYQLQQKLVFYCEELSQAEDCLNNIAQKQEDILNKLLDSNKLQQLCYSYTTHFLREGFIRKATEMTEAGIACFLEKPADFYNSCPKLKIQFCWACSICYSLEERFEEAYEQFTKVAALWNSHGEESLTLSSGMLVSYYALSGRHLFDQGKGQACSLDFPEEPNSSWLSADIIFILEYWHKGDLKKSIDAAGAINILSNTIDPHYRSLSLLTLSLCHFRRKEFSMALSYSNQLLKSEHKNTRRDIYSINLIHRIIIHIELENFELIESLVRTAENEFKQYPLLYPFVNSFMKKIRKLVNRGIYDSKLTLSEIFSLTSGIERNSMAGFYFHTVLGLNDWIYTKVKTINTLEV